MEKYIIAIAIVLSTVIYVFGNRYLYNPPTEGKNNTFYVFDKFTGKSYYRNGHNDFVGGTYTPRELKNTEE